MDAALLGSLSRRKSDLNPSPLSPVPSIKVSPGFTDLGTPDLRTLKSTAIVDLLEEQIERRNVQIGQKFSKNCLRSPAGEH